MNDRFPSRLGKGAVQMNEQQQNSDNLVSDGWQEMIRNCS